MKLSEWAKRQGISYRTAWQWFKEGTLPVKAAQAPTGTILIDVEDHNKNDFQSVAIYARVSSADQRKDLDRQVARLVAFATDRGWVITHTVSEIGSGLNGRRPKLMKFLTNPNIKIILVEHRDRLMRFGAEYIESALEAHDRKLVVADKAELKSDYMDDGLLKIELKEH